MQHQFFWLWIAFGIVAAGLIGYGFYRSVSKLYWKVVISLLPILLSAVIVTQATVRYNNGLGGFKLGVDLVGGTILVYEIDPDRKMAADYKPAQLAAALKKRIDPNDLYNVTIRPVGDTRVEIILPTGGAKQAQKAQATWNEMLQQIERHYADKLEGERLDVPRGQVNDLADSVYTKIETKQWARVLKALNDKYPKLKDSPDAKLGELRVGPTEPLITSVTSATGEKRETIADLVKANFQPEDRVAVDQYVKGQVGQQQRIDVTGEEVENIKAKIRQVGSLEFRILANKEDDRAVIDATTKYYNEPANAAALKQDLENSTKEGSIPPLPRPEDGATDWPTTRDELGRCSYAWVELGRQERESMELANRYEGVGLWAQLKAARDKGQAFLDAKGRRSILLYSRACRNPKISEKEREQKKIEYFVLTRLPEVDPENPGKRMSVTGQDLTDAKEGHDERQNLAVDFSFNSQGASRFQQLTSKNLPKEGVDRLLAVILDDMVESAATIQSTISSQGQIHGSYTQEKVDALVSILRSGALPATLKPLPVSENTIGPTLGQDTIDSGVKAIGLAFLAVLVFMCIYYRFAGFVASTALLANLLLTISFMVFVNATFTLPGLAGLVLTLGMAVDANVLIYERLREERDKGATLILALRNGYDRALPTIIDTHLTSIFTAVVLYTVGNDQLKGFGVSLFSGLVISLFTSLFVTRTIFDLWVKLDLLHNLSMFRFLTKPNFDFMRIRYYWFTATIVLTIFGLGVFLIRGPAGLNIDFVGGTAFSGQLREPIRISSRTPGEPLGLRELLSEERQKSVLAVNKVDQSDDEGTHFVISYADGQTQKVTLANRAAGESREQHVADVQKRAAVLADWSVEQIFLSSEPNESGMSRFFTVRTTEKEPDLVQVTLNRLLRDESGKTLMRQVLMSKYTLQGRRAVMDFSDFASPGFVKALLEREFRSLAESKRRSAEPSEQNSRSLAFIEGSFDTHGEGEQNEGRYKRIVAGFDSPVLAWVTDAELKQVLDQTKKEFEDRPQPERLENFDAQLAAETQKTAAYAVLASWVAILLYLWLRFGSWTFGAAAVICLIHDLFFTIGIIAFCHYIVTGVPGLASLLKLEDFKIDLPSVAALLTLIGYSVSDTIVVFDRIREVRGKNPLLTPQMINDSVNQTLSRTLLASTTVFLVVLVLYWFGGEGVHLFAFVMVVGVVVGTYSSIYIASPLLLIFGEGKPQTRAGALPKAPAPAGV